MKIAMISGTYLNSPNALFPKRILPLAKFLTEELKWDVKIYGPSVDYFSLKNFEQKVNGISIKYVGQSLHKNPFEGRVQRLKNINVVKETIRWSTNVFYEIKKFNPGIVHVFTTNPISILQGVLIKKFYTKKVLIDCDDLYGRGGWSSASYINPLITQITDLTESKIPYWFDGLSVCSHYLLHKFNDHKNLHHIPNQIDLNEFQLLDREHKRKENTILLVSGLDSEYDIDLAIKAMPLVLKQEKNAKLIIVGDGNHRIYLQNLVKRLNLNNNVKFTGWIYRKTVLKHLFRSRLALLPMREKPLNLARFPIKLLEYMAAALPIVTPKIGESTYYLEHLKSVYFVKPGDVASLAHGIVELLNDEELSRRLGKNARKIGKQFDKEKVNKKWKKLYNSVY